jgi:Na+/H+ antiporter NhaC
MEGQIYGIITKLSYAAVLDGAIFGDHTSPFSDTTIMSSLACECDPWRHVQTQFPYALFVAFGATFLGYFLVSFGNSPWISYLFFITLTSLFFWLYKKFTHPTHRIT